ncbi:MAG TPA: sugar-binding protein [Virgibacillus sp.]|nr:sugar-binding protein [Virgibacillus sp.]
MHMRSILYTVSAVLFCAFALGMFYYGYKTFYIESDAEEADDYTYHFALIAEESDNDYWRLVEKGAKTAARENDIYLEYVAPEKADNDQALMLLDRMISAKVDGIITQGIEGQHFVDLVHKGIERGIPIMTIDTDIASSERKAYVGSDNFRAGKQLGESIINDTSGKQYVGIVTGRKDSVNQQERVEGLKEAVADHPRITVVSTEVSNITKTGAAQATYSLLKEHPEITALVGTSALDGAGIVEGLKDIAPNKDVYVATFDILPETLELINDDKIAATIAQYPEEMGYNAIGVMMDLQEKDILENEKHTETMIIRKEDLQNGTEKDIIE